MKRSTVRVLSVVAVAVVGAMGAVGCGMKYGSEPSQKSEDTKRSGTPMNTEENTVEVATNVANQTTQTGETWNTGAVEQTTGTNTQQ